jgi:hypothetical protein
MPWQWILYFRYDSTLLWAVMNGHEAVVRLLLEKGAELESKDSEGQTPLSWAAAKGHEAVVQLLLEKGAEPSIAGSRTFCSGRLSRCATFGGRN